MGFGKLLAPLKIQSRDHRIALTGLAQIGDTPPALFVRFAGESNEGYQRAVRGVAERLAVHPDTANRALLMRQFMAPVYAQHVVTGWEGIYEDGADEPAPFSAEKCAEFLSELAKDPDRADVFELLGQASNRAYFRDPLPSPVSVGKE